MKTAAKMVAARNRLRIVTCISGIRRGHRMAARAGRVLDDADRPHRRHEPVEDVKLARRTLGEAGEGANRFQGREAAGDAGHRAKHAKLGAGVAILGIEGVANEAAITGLALFPAAEGADLGLELAD